MKAWHFVAHSRRLQYEDDRIVRTGRTYRTPNNDPISLCENGMHGSVRPIDALPYAPGPIVCRVDITGEIEETDNKFAGRNRKVLWMYDATRVLEKIARECALEVTECWNPPEFVINYLKTGFIRIRWVHQLSRRYRKPIYPIQDQHRFHVNHHNFWQ